MDFFFLLDPNPYQLNTPSAESLQPQIEALEEENNLPRQGESLIILEHFQNEH